ncbi:hypothetical protein CEXT_687171 [Caerostris extrusa]|uniref:Uncharacterized protein n=1 Tax=Caerostris extrusa TaxID=172846 RepID=A0AAV4NCA2_CAEEX|nr:hypothetical protein CEXT_687171 [Caerostris extrusa]
MGIKKRRMRTQKSIFVLPNDTRVQISPLIPSSRPPTTTHRSFTIGYRTRRIPLLNITPKSLYFLSLIISFVSKQGVAFFVKMTRE